MVRGVRENDEEVVLGHIWSELMSDKEGMKGNRVPLKPYEPK